MTDLHLIRMKLVPTALLQFARAQGLHRQPDEQSGYALHAWMAAMFGALSPKPFRWFEDRSELLGYAGQSADQLLHHARAFAQPEAWRVLRSESLAGKPMPTTWPIGQRLRVDVDACPISRKDGKEKDIFLRALDRGADATLDRATVYADWFRQQCGGALQFEQVHVAGFSRLRLTRRGHANGADGTRGFRTIERPQVLIQARAAVANAGQFSSLLARGIGRHRAFGFGMLLLKPGA